MKTASSALLAFILFSGLAAAARADVVLLQNGVKMEGILGTDEDGNQTLEVASGGTVVLDTSTVVEIRRQSAKENAKLKIKWADDDRDTAEKERYAAAQRAKGLILLDGEWVTPAEYDRALEREKIDVERTRAAHPYVRNVTIVSHSETYSGGTIWGHSAPRERKLHYSYTTEPASRLTQFGSSGNIIRRSEFVHSTSGHEGKYFDPSTGLYR